MTECLIALPADFSISHVSTFRQHLVAMLEQHDSFVLDDSALARIDTAGVQLMLALLSHLDAQHKSLHWQTPSQLLCTSIKQLGIQDPLLLQYL